MDCLNLYKRAKSTGNYWANAVHFTISNILLGSKELKSLGFKLAFPHIYSPRHLSASISNWLKTLTVQTVSMQKIYLAEK
jgi:hypothetical protein